MFLVLKSKKTPIILILIIFILSGGFYFLKKRNDQKKSSCLNLGKVQIVAFHRVGKEKEKEFTEKIEFLIKNKFSPVLTSDIYNFKINHQPLPKNPVLIIFEDGYPSWYNFVFPYLSKKNIKATFFVTTDFSGGIFSWEMINKMKNYTNLLGKKIFEIGSHSVSHDEKIFLKEINEQSFKINVLYELFYSKKIIDKNIKSNISFFAIPHGGWEDFSTKTITLSKIAGDVGYKVVVGSQYFIIPGKYMITAEINDDNISLPKFEKNLLKVKNKICL